jgi:large subunit ribosomal protein L5
MWHFLDKLVNITFPRVRDFRGTSSKGIDATGNLTVGFREFLSFPEIRPDEVERVHGLQITITTTAGTRKKGEALFRALGFPFKD